MSTQHLRGQAEYSKIHGYLTLHRKLAQLITINATIGRSHALLSGKKKFLRKTQGVEQVYKGRLGDKGPHKCSIGIKCGKSSRHHLHRFIRPPSSEVVQKN